MFASKILSTNFWTYRIQSVGHCRTIPLVEVIMYIFCTAAYDVNYYHRIKANKPFRKLFAYLDIGNDHS